MATFAIGRSSTRCATFLLFEMVDKFSWILTHKTMSTRMMFQVFSFLSSEQWQKAEISNFTEGCISTTSLILLASVLLCTKGGVLKRTQKMYFMSVVDADAIGTTVNIIRDENPMINFMNFISFTNWTVHHGTIVTTWKKLFALPFQTDFQLSPWANIGLQFFKRNDFKLKIYRSLNRAGRPK